MKKKLSIFISLIVVLGIITGITLGLIRKTVFNQNVGFTVSGLDAYIIYSKGTDILTGTLDPVTNYSDTAMSTEITLYKNTNKTIYGHIYLDLTTISSALAAEPALKWVITSNNTILNQGNFTNYSQGDSIPLKINIPLTTTEQRFQIYVWLDDSMDINDELEGLTLSTSVRAEASEIEYSSLPTFIRNSNAPLDSVNSTYVDGYYDDGITLNDEDKAILKTYLLNELDWESEEADFCIGKYGEGRLGRCLQYYADLYNQENDSDLLFVEVGSVSGINFRNISSNENGKGLYIRSGTENNINPIYYYRGAVDNNNVYFGGFCWKIVRTTETGGLKMIYNGTPTSGSCGSGTTSQTNSTIGNSAFNTNYNNAKYVGYTYNDNGVETDSTIKGIIDEWYENNLLTNYDNYIEDTIYCNDREEASSFELELKETLNSSINENAIYYKSLIREELIGEPSLECKNNADKYTKSISVGNGELAYPVGLLTMDELWLAGVGLDSVEAYWEIPSTYYLYSNSAFWSLSPWIIWYNNANVWSTNNIDEGGEFRVFISQGVRPVISLKPEYGNFKYGNGTGANPYRLVSTIS